MRIVLALLTCALLSANLFLPPVAAQHSSAEEAIREADRMLAKAIADKSPDRAAALYDSEALGAGSAMFPARGAADFRTNWAKEFAQPNFDLTWKTDKIVVTESGALAYASGTWQDHGKTIGPFLEVWRKQADGKWKIVIDAAWLGQPSE